MAKKKSAAEKVAGKIDRKAKKKYGSRGLGSAAAKKARSKRIAGFGARRAESGVVTGATATAARKAVTGGAGKKGTSRTLQSKLRKAVASGNKAAAAKIRGQIGNKLVRGKLATRNEKGAPVLNRSTQSARIKRNVSGLDKSK